MSFSPAVPFTVYCKECWWSDKWDSRQYGADYDFSKPFFEQFRELLKRVPRPGIVHQGTIVNSQYTNRVSNLKDCYLIYGSNFNEHCFYGTWFNDAKDSFDGLSVQKSEQCYECIDCFQCQHLLYSQECTACSNSFFLFNCRNCESCFGCVNLRNKSNCIFNVQYSKEEYKKLVAQFNVGSYMMRDALEAKFKEAKVTHIVPSLVAHHSQNISGNWIEESKNIFRGFTCRKVEDARYVYGLVESKDAIDYCFWGRTTELVYESINVGYQSSNIRCSTEIWDQVRNATYSMNCHNSHDLFGCIGLRNAEYAILNKQYSQEEFERQSAKIIEQMKTVPYTDSQGRIYKYGEFFPVDYHLFAYNEATAHEYFPLAREEAVRRGYSWKEPEERNYQVTVFPEQLPDHIKDVSDDMVSQTIGCAHKGTCNEQCTTAFRLTRDELQFYRAHEVPLPRLCPNCRHRARLNKRNPLKLWHRVCACNGAESRGQITYRNTAAHAHGVSPCPNKFETSYAPERPEIVYCEQCYQAEVA